MPRRNRRAISSSWMYYPNLFNRPWLTDPISSRWMHCPNHFHRTRISLPAFEFPLPFACTINYYNRTYMMTATPLPVRSEENRQFVLLLRGIPHIRHQDRYHAHEKALHFVYVDVRLQQLSPVLIPSSIADCSPSPRAPLPACTIKSKQPD